MKIRYLVVAVVLVGVAVAAWFGWQQFGPGAQAAPQATRTGLVARQSLDLTVSASGTLDAESRVDVRFASSGHIHEVLVREGDTVTAGQTLARLDTAALELDVADARTQLELAQVQLEQLQQPPKAEDLAVAEAALASAKAALTELSKPVDRNLVEIARLGIERARIQLWQAQLGNPDPALRSRLPSYLFDLGRLATDAGDVTVTQAELNYQLARKGATADQLIAGRAQVDQAQANLDRLKAGPREEDLAVARAQIDQAQLAVDAAEARLANAVLTAPAGGVIATVNARAGELAVPGVPAFVLVDTARFHLDVAVDEIDVARLAVSQPVTITLDGLPGQSFTGRVGRIATLATNLAGVVSYAVRVDLDHADGRLRPGMTANAVVVTEHRADVLVVPNWAVRIDRQTGQATVPVRRNGQVVEVPVELGARVETVSEVLSGVHEGEELVLLTTRQQLSFFGGQ
jgi:HlyD family secretion protein